ncbi:MAG: carboxypeptidase regulatory-like domain-containing protein [Gemmatimonadetes bacterium]|nr:carboxypeptidase regulatory-like domain-containing protein [Gemmatimonadota bacterium]
MSVSRKMRQAVRGLAALVALLAIPLAAQGQAGRIAGTVSDSAKRPLDNASVSVVGTRYGAISDASGRYTVNNVPAGTYTVRVQRIGNKAVEVPNVVVTAGATAEVNVSLNAAALQLGGVVVSASRRVEKITDAPATVTRLEAAQIANSVGNSFAGALKEVKGIDYIQVGMTAVAINARGFNSSFNNRMLMMEDGRVAVLPENGLPVGGFTSIPKVDLAGVEVLIGPGSALYGPDASNGVLTLQSKGSEAVPGDDGRGGRRLARLHGFPGALRRRHLEREDRLQAQRRVPVGQRVPERAALRGERARAGDRRRRRLEDGRDAW